MNGITYGITEEIYSVGGQSRVSYGIAVYADAECDGSATILTSVKDITSDKERLSELVRSCNLLGLSMIHLDDVIEDFLTD